MEEMCQELKDERRLIAVREPVLLIGTNHHGLPAVAGPLEKG